MESIAGYTALRQKRREYHVRKGVMSDSLVYILIIINILVYLIGLVCLSFRVESLEITHYLSGNLFAIAIKMQLDYSYEVDTA